MLLPPSKLMEVSWVKDDQEEGRVPVSLLLPTLRVERVLT
jgi:hypothetical protein